MLSKKMVEINEKYPLAGMDRKEAAKMLKKEGLPAWCVRQSDLPTYALGEVAKAASYKPQTVEPFRETNGYLEVKFDGKYWKCTPVLKDAFAETDEGKAVLADFAEMEKGNVYVNTTNFSSERRHCLAIAKAAAVTYKLAFVETKDVEAVDPKALQNKERRVEIYKFGSKMNDGKTEGGENKEGENKPEGGDTKPEGGNKPEGGTSEGSLKKKDKDKDKGKPKDENKAGENKQEGENKPQ